ncbi:MAG TPA: fibronectin type III domain-containing protein [Acidimicrobiia bacterium]|nr:fibronectin type III domain-containing protein [Acidimicrobiia bacterium]
MLFRSLRELSRPAQARQWLVAGTLTALFATTLPLTAQAASQAEVVLNSAGGNSAGDGLRIHYGNGQLQVARNGANQMYYPWQTPGSVPNPWIYNAIALNIDGVAYTPGAISSINGAPFANTTQSGGSTGSGTIAGTLETGVAGFDVDVTITYTLPNDYFNVTLVVNRGATTQPLKLYHFIDSYLAGADEGPGFFTASPATVGVAKPGTVEAFRHVSGPAWTGYFSGNFQLPWPQVAAGQNFDDAINADPTTDNGFGIMWDLGTAAGTHTVSYDMILITDAPLVPDSMVAPTAVGGDASAAVSLTAPADNGSAITAYTVTALPGGATCTVAAATSCAVSGLTNGATYTFTATATNGNGTSNPSVASNSVTPSGPPATMTAPTAVAGNTMATVTVTSPDGNGSVITGYAVTAAPGGATCAIVPAAVTCAVTGLTNGIAYTFTATATNGHGTSIASPPSNSVTPTAPSPDPGPTPTPTANPIFDVGGSWFDDIPPGEIAVAASWLASQGITLGCEGGANPRFCPNDLATRAGMAAFLTRALGLPASGVDAFQDDNGHSLEDGLNRTAAADIFLGCSNDRDVCPDDAITRGELAAVLVRALDLAANNPGGFADVGDHWARTFIETIGGLGISIGCESDGGRFCPDDFATRGEIALFLYRALTTG